MLEQIFENVMQILEQLCCFCVCLMKLETTKKESLKIIYFQQVPRDGNRKFYWLNLELIVSDMAIQNKVFEKKQKLVCSFFLLPFKPEMGRVAV